jgi:hypothetical protein
MPKKSPKKPQSSEDVPMTNITYTYVTLERDDGKSETLRVDKLVLKAFNVPNPNNWEHVKHLDGITTNNALHNLAWSEHP